MTNDKSHEFPSCYLPGKILSVSVQYSRYPREEFWLFPNWKNTWDCDHRVYNKENPSRLPLKGLKFKFEAISASQLICIIWWWIITNNQCICPNCFCVMTIESTNHLKIQSKVQSWIWGSEKWHLDLSRAVISFLEYLI